MASKPKAAAAPGRPKKDPAAAAAASLIAFAQPSDGAAREELGARVAREVVDLVRAGAAGEHHPAAIADLHVPADGGAGGGTGGGAAASKASAPQLKHAAGTAICCPPRHRHAFSTLVSCVERIL